MWAQMQHLVRDEAVRLARSRRPGKRHLER
jgi:hypothetical protein